MHRVALRSLGLLTILMLATALAVPAVAHDYLVSSTPDTDETVSAAPSEVVLEFNTAIQQQFAQVAVVDRDGNTYQDGEPVVDGAVVTQAVSGLPESGDITVSYRIVSSDGHPIGGTVPFSIGGAPDDATQAGTTDSGTTDAETSDAETAPDEAALDEPTDEATANATADDDSDGSASALLLIGVGVAVLAAAALAAAARRRQTRSGVNG